MSRKKHDTTPVAKAAELAHELVRLTPPSETKADWIETVPTAVATLRTHSARRSATGVRAYRERRVAAENNPRPGHALAQHDPSLVRR